MIGEFSLISKYFTKDVKDQRLVKGIGDDCALLSLSNDELLAITTDTLNENIHFFKDEDPFFLGYKSLLVNVSDLASMGALPKYYTLSITLPNSDEEFLDKFSKGLFSLSDKLNMALIGGNTSKGPLSITIEAFGTIKKGYEYLREKANNNDNIYITNTLGVAALFVDAKYNKININKESLDYTHKKAMLMEDRCAFSCALNSYVHSAIDISDGLIGDLKHILELSNKGANLDLSNFIFDDVFALNAITKDKALDYALYGGGDYELLFLVNDQNENKVLDIAKKHNLLIQKIGKITDKKDLIINFNNNRLDIKKAFEHF